MRTLSVFCMAALMVAGFSGCGAKACCKDKCGVGKCAMKEGRDCGSGACCRKSACEADCTKPCCASKK